MSASIKKKIFNKKNVIQNIFTIYGIGKKQATDICKKVGIQPNFIFNNLKETQKAFLLNIIEKSYPLIETNLKIEKKNNYNFLEQVKNYRFVRNKLGLPSRGQRTHSNASTKKKLKNGS